MRPHRQNPLPGRIKAVDALLNKAEVPGMSMAVIRGGKISWCYSFGVKDALKLGQRAVRVRDDTLFPGASLGKPVFAYIALRLADRGTLDLDRPLYLYLPNARLASDDRYKRITARMILIHTSGLPNFGGTPLELQFEPGSRFGYSSEGYLYLQAALEKITGKSLEELAREEVFVPFKMTHSTYVWSPALRGNLATGDGGRATPWIIRGPTASAASSLLTTPTDYAKFVIAIMNGQGLKDGTVRAMTTPQVSINPADLHPKVWWASGFAVEKGGAGMYFWHVGNTGGFKCFAIASRETKEGLVYFTNSINGFAISDPLVLSLLHGTHPMLDVEGFHQARYDAPDVACNRELMDVFLRDGAKLGLRSFRALRKRAPNIATRDFTRNLGNGLRERGLADAAIAVFKEYLKNYPGSVEVGEDLIATYIEGDQAEVAVSALEKGELVDPRSESSRAKLLWLKEYVGSLRYRANLSASQLQGYKGTFGESTITASGERLAYHVTKGEKGHLLIPLGQSLFSVAGMPSIRLRFEGLPGSGATQIQILHMDGSAEVFKRAGSR